MLGIAGTKQRNSKEVAQDRACCYTKMQSAVGYSKTAYEKVSQIAVGAKLIRENNEGEIILLVVFNFPSFQFDKATKLVSLSQEPYFNQ